MDLDLRGQSALITGASKGIGKAIAQVLAAEGCCLHLAARSQEPLSELADELTNKYGVIVQTHALDLQREDDADRLVVATGPVDILVNNAGAVPRGGLSEVDEKMWRAGWELKVFGYIRLCRAFLPIMCERKSGVIINVIGVAGQRPDANYIATSSANAALMMFSESLGGDSVRHGVRVVGVNPGLVATDRFLSNIKRRAELKFGSADRWQEMLSDLPIGRPAQPEEIADAVAFLASKRASYISGTIVTIDGGLRARPTSGI
jgi:NAD(P)-dependent dehydrogenase (short-subunit alcohol dehydrogenase family)